MKIKSGIDLVNIKRFKRTIQKYGRTFIEKIFTFREIAYCENKRNKYEHYASRFAAKEAFYKALGGIAITPRFKDVEVINKKNGAPELIINANYRKKIGFKKKTNISLSITHEKDYASALVNICN